MVYFQGPTRSATSGRLRAEAAAISEEDFRHYSGGVAALYVEADRILGELPAAPRRTARR